MFNPLLWKVALIFIKLVIILLFSSTNCPLILCIAACISTETTLNGMFKIAMFLFVKQGKSSDTNYHVVIVDSACEIKLKRVGEWVDIVEHEQGSKRTKTKLIKTSLCMLSYSGVPVTRSLVLYSCFVDRCLSFCTFSFGHCVVCSSSIYGLWLPLWYLQTLIDQYAELNICACYLTVQ
jgi:hypothetical protein